MIDEIPIIGVTEWALEHEHSNAAPVEKKENWFLRVPNQLSLLRRSMLNELMPEKFSVPI
jgi:hypothetical protein